MYGLLTESQRRYVEPAAFGPRPHTLRGQLHSLSGLQKSMREGSVLEDMPQEHLPLNLECIVCVICSGNCLPAIEEVNRIRNIRIPHRLGSRNPRLHLALAKANDRAAIGSVDLQDQQVIAID